VSANQKTTGRWAVADGKDKLKVPSRTRKRGTTKTTPNRQGKSYNREDQDKGGVIEHDLAVKQMGGSWGKTVTTFKRKKRNKCQLSRRAAANLRAESKTGMVGSTKHA